MPYIDVTVFDSTGTKKLQLELPDDAQSGRLVESLIDKMKLPKIDPNGYPMGYKFHHNNTQLQDYQTLSEVGVRNGDLLRLHAVITAG